MHPTNCLNCGSNLDTYKFCPVCGQKATTHRLNFHDLWHDLLHYFTHADKSIFSLIRELAIRPGVVAREYIAGKRAKYFKPFNFYLVVGTITVLMLTWFHLPTEDMIANMEQVAAKTRDADRRKEILEMAERTRFIYHYMISYSNILNMLITPLYAFVFWLFYKKAQYSYIEHLVASMFFISFIMLFNGLLIVPWQNKISYSQSWIFFLIPDVTYRSLAYRQFMGKKGIGPLLKAIGVSLFVLLFWAMITSYVLQQFIMTGFK